jgi:hypothetical protein
MDGLSLTVPLQNQHAWAFVILRIIFDHDGIRNPCHDIRDKDIIFG